MELLSAIAAIVLIDLVLSGDNAAVIGLAIKNLPEQKRVSAACIGAGGAIILRVIFTILATLLIRVPYLNAIGGVILFWITWKLLRDNQCQEEEICGSGCYWAAVWSIIIADVSMAFDNVMGVAGAAHGEIWLVIFGLALSIPILVIGSSWLAKLMNRFPIIVYLGGAVLIHTAAQMILDDRALRLKDYLGQAIPIIIAWGLGIILFLYGVCHLTYNYTRVRVAAASEENPPKERPECKDNR